MLDIPAPEPVLSVKFLIDSAMSTNSRPVSKRSKFNRHIVENALMEEKGDHCHI